MEYDWEITRCIQSSVARQQQEEKEMIDEQQDQLTQQHQQQQHQMTQQMRLQQQQLPCQARNSEQITLNLNTDTGDVQHSYINSNGVGNATYAPSNCGEHGGSWDAAQNNPGNYVDYVGPHDLKRCRFDHGE
jgi:hypothetical protein